MLHDTPIKNKLIQNITRFDELSHVIFAIFIINYQPKNKNFIAKKWDSDFGKKYKTSILVKNSIFLSSFSIVVQPNEAVQLKVRLF